MKKKIIKILAAVMAIAVASQTTVFATEIKVLEDCKGQPYETAVTALMEKGIITGDVDGLFHPNDNLTRAQACKIVVSTINPTDAELNGTVTLKPADAGFTDMAGASWALPYVNYAAANGIIKGYPDGTFKPGGMVTVAELDAMLVRAAKIKESELTGSWPDNYVNKAAELGFYNGTGLVDQYGNYYTGTAEKWMAAWLTYNALDIIEAANPKTEIPQGTDKDKVSQVPDKSEFTMARGSFDINISTYNKIPLAKDVKIYTYEIKKNYSEDMLFTTRKADYAMETVYKFKSVNTPAWYKVEDGKIVAMILPQDVGFTGLAYGVVNGTCTMLNYENRGVTALETLTAANEITWKASSSYSSSITRIQQQVTNSIKDGDIYEIKVKDGEIINVTNDPVAKLGRYFKELNTSGWQTVTETDLKNNLVALGTSWYELRDNPAVYVLNDEGTAFEVGSKSKITKNDSVRLYDISDDDESLADIIVVKKN